MLLGTMLLFVLLSGAFILVGINFWARPRAAIDRVTGATADPMPMVAHPSLAWHELVKKLGTLVPASPRDSTIVQRRLIRAGFRNPGAIKFLYGAKVVFGVLLPLVTLGLVLRSDTAPNRKF